MSRIKSASDPELVCDRSSPPVPGSNFQERILNSLTDDDYHHRSGTYGSIQEQKRVSCCAAGEHFMTSTSQEFIRRSLSMDSAVHVDISDINGEGDVSYVPLTLRRCKRTIIAPHSCLLSFIGWRPWFQESMSRRSSFWKYFNCFYPAVIMALIISHYIFQVLNCQGKFNIHVDIEPSPKPSIPQVVNMTGNCSWGIITFVCHAKYIVDAVEKDTTRQASGFCQHIIPTYVIPSFVHFLAFAYGFYHFRLVACEQLFSLMERVFLQCHSTPSLQNSLIRNSRLFFTTALIWLLLQVALEILYCFSFPQERLEMFGPSYKYVFMAIKMLGLVLVQGVNVAVIINYCVQCETLILYIKGICLKLHEKSMELKSAMHEILGVREYISSLNGNVAKMMALLIVNFAELTILGTALLFLNRSTSKNVISYRVIFPVLWFTALILPLIQLLLHVLFVLFGGLLNTLFCSAVSNVYEVYSPELFTIKRLVVNQNCFFSEVSEAHRLSLYLNKIYRSLQQPKRKISSHSCSTRKAARLTRIGSKLRQISFETRVFGYQNCSMLELDSFVLFVNGATLRSKLFGITIRSSTVIMTLGLSVFILLTLMVVDILTVSGYSQLF